MSQICGLKELPEARLRTAHEMSRAVWSEMAAVVVSAEKAQAEAIVAQIEISVE